MKDICIDCGRDTSFGSGLFVNRLPADNGKKSGYLCVECLSMECDHCGELSAEYGSDEEGGIICSDCEVSS
jgi:hypothetical protein